MTVGLARVSPSMARIMVDRAKAKGYRHGVIGLRGLPDAESAADLQHAGQTIHIRPAESALAARELLLDPPPQGWLVLVTDRPEDDLGAGILARLVWSRLTLPYAWDAVRDQFSASAIEAALVAGPHNRQLATAILEATPADGWPPAPAGMLTRPHLLRAVAEAHLDVDPTTADTAGVLRWAMKPGTAGCLLTLRQHHGNLLADETLGLLADLTGSAAPITRHLLANGEIGELTPVALALDVLTTAPQGTERATARARLEERFGIAPAPEAAARALGHAATSVAGDDLRDPQLAAFARRALTRADDLLRACGAGSLAAASAVLPAGRVARQATLASAIRACVSHPDAPHVADVGAAWTSLLGHQDRSPLTSALPPLEAGVRLCRWLSGEPTDGGSGADADLSRLAHTHLDDWSWADAAVNDASVGVDDPDLGSALDAVIAAALDRRRGQDRAFAAALAAVTARGAGHVRAAGVSHDHEKTWYLEHLLPEVVLPFAQENRTLLVVLDGMSAASANEVVPDAVDRLGWVEVGLAGRGRRTAALSVLPSLTEVSRCSLLSGRLARGDQGKERAGHAALLRDRGMTGQVFHKKAIEMRTHGSAVADQVGRAIDGDDHLVSVVLNTIDDALDRSDPGGTAWTTDAVKHLAPLLGRAASSGRAVIMTADHGHVVERRAGTQHAHPDPSSGRSRAVEPPAATGEVLVEGERVLTPTRSAVLAVDESLRYGPLKAGYHGGASASEVVVPVIALVHDEDHAVGGLIPLPPQAPAWWYGEIDVAAPQVTDPRMPITTTSRLETQGTLFEQIEPPQVLGAPSTEVSLGQAVVRSATFAGQLNLTGRTTLAPDRVAGFIDQASSISGGRVPRPLVAQALGIPVSRLHGAVAQLAKLLNVEGYGVVRTDPGTGAIELDAALLREQFGVGG